MPLAHIVIGVGATGSEVEVDGRSLPVAGWRLEQQPGDVPRLTVELAGEGSVDTEGMAQLAPPDISRFLDGMDAETLEKLALNRSVMDGQPFVKAILLVLAEMLQGKVAT